MTVVAGALSEADDQTLPCVLPVGREPIPNAAGGQSVDFRLSTRGHAPATAVRKYNAGFCKSQSNATEILVFSKDAHFRISKFGNVTAGIEQIGCQGTPLCRTWRPRSCVYNLRIQTGFHHSLLKWARCWARLGKRNGEDPRSTGGAWPDEHVDNIRHARSFWWKGRLRTVRFCQSSPRRGLIMSDWGCMGAQSSESLCQVQRRKEGFVVSSAYPPGLLACGRPACGA